ncbi:alcohol dehydrogenase catalytic domain-containing protein [Kitasatospora sp. SUK 42]|uniref:alcohol dehydrogenase catalytic domain-containing protein n=1 Tax=Kitasatospora sp. SUK 42 TaxID=1588882 RepID=UPI0018CA7641|nr:alcohol dehydrogenase catalytic domain-containing protein [Kitasatospora sp. SUK 42]MBV2156591.1 alcohol dehydrogenase catalytic domain-containing protein [Kitasatospora sp. SUK 42]
MRATVVPGVGAAWATKEIPRPHPGPGEVLIRVRACGICVNDVLASRGVLPFPTTDPAVPGHEPVGEVVEVGAGVTARREGDRVGVTWVQAGCGRCAYCRRGLPPTGQTALNCEAPVTTGFTAQGGLAEYLVAPAAATVLLPDGLSYEQAAPMMCAGYTAWSALSAADARPHERVAVLGIGAVGHLALQLAKACGLEAVAITHSPDKHDVARELGADLVVADGAGLRAAGGADVVLATGSSYRAASDSLRGLRTDGRLVLSGLDAGGGFDLSPARPFFAQRHRIIGSTHNGPARLAELLELAAAGRCVAMTEVFEADRAAEAAERVAAGQVRFRAVVGY